jgi:nitroimidazol reductase NimA-like FMN-containing flavoprotein (pyridoxamine 5'-phosphate oxidase superfamily)
MAETKFHMRRKEREVTDPQKMQEIIKKSTICRLGLVNNGEAYIVPVNFGYMNNSLYFHSALEGRKVDLLNKNKRVTFEIEGDYSIDKAGKTGCDVKYQSIFGKGTADFIEDREEKIRGLKAIMRQCTGSEYAFSLDKLSTVLVVRIDIDSMTCKQAGF